MGLCGASPTPFLLVLVGSLFEFSLFLLLEAYVWYDWKM